MTEHKLLMSPTDRAENLPTRSQKDKFWNYADTPNPATGAMRSEAELHKFLDEIADDIPSMPAKAVRSVGGFIKGLLRTTAA